MTVQEMFNELIHYANYDYLLKLEDKEIKELYNSLLGD